MRTWIICLSLLFTGALTATTFGHHESNHVLPNLIGADSVAADDHADHADHDGHADDAHDDHAHDSHAEPSVFAGTIAQSIAAIVVFLILFALLYKMAWGPILSGLQEREAKIKGDIEEAEKAAVEAKQTLETYQKQLAEAQQEAAKIVETARADAMKVKSQLTDDTQREVTAMKDRATADINAAKEQALSELYTNAATLSTQIAGRILGREINAADQQKLVEDSLAELTGQGSSQN